MPSLIGNSFAPFPLDEARDLLDDVDINFADCTLADGTFSAIGELDKPLLFPKKRRRKLVEIRINNVDRMEFVDTEGVGGLFVDEIESDGKGTLTMTGNPPGKIALATREEFLWIRRRSMS